MHPGALSWGLLATRGETQGQRLKASAWTIVRSLVRIFKSEYVSHAYPQGIESMVSRRAKREAQAAGMQLSHSKWTYGALREPECEYV
jgi:hypothetical protein